MRNNTFMSIISIIALTVALGGSPADAAQTGMRGTEGALTAITGIYVTDTTVEIKGDKAFIYTIYMPSDPYRVVVEIPDADIGSFRDVIKPKSSMITEITPSQVTTPKQVAKFDILLQTPSGIDSEYAKNSLILKPKKVSPDAPSSSGPGGQEPKMAQVRPEAVQMPEEKTLLPKATEITDIGFEPGEGVVKVVLKGNGAMSPSVFTLKNRVVVDIPDVSLKAAIPSTLMQPVKGLRAGKFKGGTRFVVDLNGTRDFDVLAVKDTIVVSLKTSEPAMAAARSEEAPAATSGGPGMEPRKFVVEGKSEMGERRPAGEALETREPDAFSEGKYTGTKISLDFQDSDIVPIFRLLSDISNRNIVVNPEVKGKLTMKLINVPWDQALDLILKSVTPPLGKSIEGDIIRIAPITVFTRENEERKKQQESAVQAEPLETRFFAVNYADVKVVEQSIKDSKVLSARGSVSVDKRTSTMVVKDGASVFAQVRQLLDSLDKPTAQVMIEGRIVEMNTNDSRDLGIQWGLNLNAANTLSQFTGLSGLGTAPFTGNKFMVDVPANISGRGSGFNFGILSPDRTVGLDIQLSALSTIGNTKVISNPKILTVDNGKAKIMQGKSIPVRKLTTEGTVSTEFKDITIELNVVPHITPDGSVGLDIEIKKEEIDPSIPSIEGVPGTDKKEAKTNVIIKDGETIVIGGMYKLNASDSVAGVPGLLNVPILGWLFKNTQTVTVTNELLIFITPRVVEKL
jgi:type IV pilus secretin PilQ/predicted competence protein